MAERGIRHAERHAHTPASFARCWLLQRLRHMPTYAQDIPLIYEISLLLRFRCVIPPYDVRRQCS